MILLYKDQVLCDVPDSLVANDFVRVLDTDYIIKGRVYDQHENKLYAECELIQRIVKENKLKLIDILKKIYKSDRLITSGPNTNEIMDNPRLKVFMVIVLAFMDKNLLDQKFIDELKKKVITKWNDVRIPFSELIDENILSMCSDKCNEFLDKEIINILIGLSKEYKLVMPGVDPLKLDII